MIKSPDQIEMEFGRRQKLGDLMMTGAFKQARGVLMEDYHTMCAAGVACELHRMDTGEGRWSYEHDDEGVGDWWYITATDKSHRVMPVEVADYYGFDQEGTFVTDVDDGVPHTTDLIGLNDDDTISLKQTGTYVSRLEDYGGTLWLE